MYFKKRTRIRLIVQSLRVGKLLQQSMKEASVSKSTFYRWMRENPRLNRLIEKTRELSLDHRIACVEDALFYNATVNNSLGAQCFFLTNHAPNRYKNNRDNYAPLNTHEMELQEAEVQILSPKEEAEAKELLKEFAE